MKKKYESPCLHLEELLHNNVLMESDTDASDNYASPWDVRDDGANDWGQD